MNHKIVSLLALALVFVLLGSCGPTPMLVPTPSAMPTDAPTDTAEPIPQPTVLAYTPDLSQEFRGVWVTTLLNLDYPSRQGLSAQELRDQADALLDTVVEMGFNAVFFQVRPAGDAFYPSQYLPWSRFLSGTQGIAPEEGFDPLLYFVEGAHARDLELHAWLNLLRAARNRDEWDTLAPDNPAVLHPEWTLQAGEMTLYNPGLPEVRTFLLDTVRELCENYQVDGIHYDDYFYPQETWDDSESYARYGTDFTADDWRRENINTLIRETGVLVRQIRPDCRFGVSPSGVWRNALQDLRGSDTWGNDSYSAQYADSLLWVEAGWVDYIAPQLYWEIGNERTDYHTLVDWWAAAVEESGVDLYIGQATYLANSAEAPAVWQGTEELGRQIALNRTYPQVKGSIHFRYAMIAQNQPVREAIQSLYNDAIG